MAGCVNVSQRFRTRRRACRSATALLALGCAWGLSVGPAAAAGFTVNTNRKLGKPVGMAADLNNDWYWITDGSSSTVRSLLAVDKSGKEAHRVTWESAFHDVEAL